MATVLASVRGPRERRCSGRFLCSTVAAVPRAQRPHAHEINPRIHALAVDTQRHTDAGGRGIEGTRKAVLNDAPLLVRALD